MVTHGIHEEPWSRKQIGHSTSELVGKWCFFHGKIMIFHEKFVKMVISPWEINGGLMGFNQQKW